MRISDIKITKSTIYTIKGVGHFDSRAAAVKFRREWVTKTGRFTPPPSAAARAFKARAESIQGFLARRPY